MDKTTLTPKRMLTDTGQLINEAISDYRQNWKKFVCLLIVPMIISFIGSTVSFVLQLFFNDTTKLGMPVSILVVVLGLIWVIFFAFIYFHAYIAEFLFLKDLSAEVSLKNLADWYKKARPYILRIAVISIAFTILAVLGFIALVIPGVMFCVFYAFTIYAVIFEDLAIKAAFKRSKELVSGYFWPVFGRFVAGGLLAYLVYIVIAGIYYAIVYLLANVVKIPLSENVITLIYDFISVISSLVIGPVSLIYTYKIYRSLREVKNI